MWRYTFELRQNVALYIRTETKCGIIHSNWEKEEFFCKAPNLSAEARVEERKCRFYEIISTQIKQTNQTNTNKNNGNDSEVEGIQRDWSGKLFAYNHFLYKNKPPSYSSVIN